MWPKRKKKERENHSFHTFPIGSLISSGFPFCFDSRILYINLECNINIKHLRPNCFHQKLPKEPTNRVNIARESFILTGCITSTACYSVPKQLQLKSSPTKHLLTVTPQLKTEFVYMCKNMSLAEGCQTICLKATEQHRHPGYIQQFHDSLKIYQILGKNKEKCGQQPFESVNHSQITCL